MAKLILPHAPPDAQAIEYHPICLKFIDREQHQPEAFAHLCNSIRKNGLRHPIVTHDGMILDGRNRHKACLQVGVEPRFKPLPDGEDPLEYAIEENITTDGQYTVGQRALIAARMVTTKQGGQPLKVSSETFVSVEKASSLLDISVSSVKRGIYILKYADDEMIASIESGDLAITKAETVIREAQVAATREAERQAEREANPEEYARQAERRAAAWEEMTKKAAARQASHIESADKAEDVEEEPAAEESATPMPHQLMESLRRRAAEEQASHAESSIESSPVAGELSEFWCVTYRDYTRRDAAYTRMAQPGTVAKAISSVDHVLYIQFRNPLHEAVVDNLFPYATKRWHIDQATFEGMAQDHRKLWRAAPDPVAGAAAELSRTEAYAREKTETPAQELARVSQEMAVKREYEIPDGIPGRTSTLPRGEFCTPPFWIERARFAMGSIDFDPASSDLAQRNVEAAAYLTLADDALDESTEWGGPNLFISPPAALEPMRKFAMRLLAELKAGTFEQAIWLSYALTYTNYGQELLQQAMVVFFPKHRILFLNEQGHELPPGPVPNMLVGLGPRLDIGRFKEAFEGHGTCLFPQIRTIG